MWNPSVFGNKFVLQDPCEIGDNSCDVDELAYKGIAARSFARAALYAPSIAIHVAQVLNASSKAAASSCNQVD